jgi:hypothetical protein
MREKILTHTLVHTQPRDSATLSSHCSHHCLWTVARPWRESTGTSVSNEGQGWKSVAMHTLQQIPYAHREF